MSLWIGLVYPMTPNTKKAPEGASSVPLPFRVCCGIFAMSSSVDSFPHIYPPRQPDRTCTYASGLSRLAGQTGLIPRIQGCLGWVLVRDCKPPAMGIKKSGTEIERLTRLEGLQ